MDGLVWRSRLSYHVTMEGPNSSDTALEAPTVGHFITKPFVQGSSDHYP